MAKTKKQSIAIYERTRFCDTHKCKWCGDIVDTSESIYELDLGWICDQCANYLKSRNERVIFVR